jgi:competence protein ComEA
VRVSRSDRLLIAGAGVTVIVAMAVAWLLFAPAGSTPAPTPGVALTSGVAGASPPTGQQASGEIVVDVEGAVVHPGVHALPAGARVADALAAAGGYSTKVDLAAASQLLNLARSLVDGEQIHVPAIGENAVAAGSAGPAASNAAAAGGGGGTSGLVNLNTATPEELEALPGIGPVTVQKIVAARQEHPFSSLDDAVTRGVIDRGQLEDITGLATAG